MSAPEPWLPSPPPADMQGWFPVLIVWEADEGFFPAAKFWDGARWLDGADAERATGEPVAFFMMHECAAADAAREIAYANDPDAEGDANAE